MGDPYEVLGLEPGASETEIRNRYLQLVREFPPDRAPERFASIRAAFDVLSDPVGRVEHQILRLSTADTLVALGDELRARLAGARLSSDALLSLADLP
jgi:curved DNA-binding protein CbpA